MAGPAPGAGERRDPGAGLATAACAAAAGGSSSGSWRGGLPAGLVAAGPRPAVGGRARPHAVGLGGGDHRGRRRRPRAGGWSGAAGTVVRGRRGPCAWPRSARRPGTISSAPAPSAARPCCWSRAWRWRSRPTGRTVAVAAATAGLLVLAAAVHPAALLKVARRRPVTAGLRDGDRGQRPAPGRGGRPRGDARAVLGRAGAADQRGIGRHADHGRLRRVPLRRAAPCGIGTRTSRWAESWWPGDACRRGHRVCRATVRAGAPADRRGRGRRAAGGRHPAAAGAAAGVRPGARGEHGRAGLPRAGGGRAGRDPRPRRHGRHRRRRRAPRGRAGGGVGLRLADPPARTGGDRRPWCEQRSTASPAPGGRGQLRRRRAAGAGVRAAHGPLPGGGRLRAGAEDLDDVVDVDEAVLVRRPGGPTARRRGPRPRRCARSRGTPGGGGARCCSAGRRASPSAVRRTSTSPSSASACSVR